MLCMCLLYVILLLGNITTAVVYKLQCWCRSMSPSLCANLAYVSVTVSNVAASKCPHCCSVNAAMLPPLYVAIIVCKSCVCVYYFMQCCKMSPLRWCKMLLKLRNATAAICYCHTLYWSKPQQAPPYEVNTEICFLACLFDMSSLGWLKRHLSANQKLHQA